MSRRKQSKGKTSKKWNNRRRKATRRSNSGQLAQFVDWMMPDGSIFSKTGVHGNTKCDSKELVSLALMWSWSERRNVTDAYTEAADCCESISRSFVPSTYQGFMKALVARGQPLLKTLQSLLHGKMEKIGGRFWRIGNWVPIAFDGSRSTAPRTKDNEKAFCAKNYGKGNTAKYRKKKSKGMRRKKNEKAKPQSQEPQAWITMLWHMGLRLPWTWQLGPSNASERADVMKMIDQEEYPKNTLFCGDAGFVGFPLWSCIVRNGGHFLVRVGGNVNLLRENANYEFVDKQTVLCWPKNVQSKHPPLRLRLVKVSIGKTKVYLLTNILDPNRLTMQQMIKFYKMRWGIEIEFRGLKQTLDRVKLRCRNDKRLLVELDWSIMGMAVAELFALKEQLSEKPKTSKRGTRTPDPNKRSLANTMRAIRRCIRTPNDAPRAGKDLQTLLREAVTDDYQRKSSKKARYRPPNPDKKKLGKPKIRKLTRKEQKKLDEMQSDTAA